MSKRLLFVSALLLPTMFMQGCSTLRQYAVNSVGDSLASGGAVYERDDDIVLIGDALPFSLKLLDSLLAQAPRHRGLLLSASRGYLLYTYAYVDEEAERLAQSDLEQAAVGRARAHRLYLRAHDYAVRGLEVTYPGLRQEFARDPVQAVRRVGGSGSSADVALLHSAAATLALAISSDKQDVAMLARLPEVDAYLARALELDEVWKAGALHELAVSWLSSRPGLHRNDTIERHYARALELSGGHRAGVYVGYAEAVMIPAQKRSEFVRLMNQALAVDLDADPDNKLLNALAQRRARWQLGHLDELFLE
jgi:predicted anti-sigma-YlaC factor YlaD